MVALFNAFDNLLHHILAPLVRLTPGGRDDARKSVIVALSNFPDYAETVKYAVGDPNPIFCHTFNIPHSTIVVSSPFPGPLAQPVKRENATTFIRDLILGPLARQ